MTYRISVYEKRATVRVGDTDTGSLAAAFRIFMATASARLHRREDCVLLIHVTRENGGTVLAAKSTDGHHIEVHRAFFDQEAQPFPRDLSDHLLPQDRVENALTSSQVGEG